MNFTFLHKFEEKESAWIDVIWYVSLALLFAAVFSWGMMYYKIYLQEQDVAQLSIMMNDYGTPLQRTAEKQVTDYKKKIDDFSTIVASRKISSGIFTFIEQKTLPNVWFSDFDMSESKDKIQLAGQAATMEALSRQVQLFEQSPDSVSEVSVVNSQASADGKTTFILSLSLNPKVFGALPATPSSSSPTL